MSTPPPVGKTLSVKVDDQTYDVLAAMTDTGMTVTEAVRCALLVVGGTYRKVWAAGHTPYGVRPNIEAFFISTYDADQSTDSPIPPQDVPRAYRAHPTPDPTTRTTVGPAVTRTADPV